MKFTFLLLVSIFSSIATLAQTVDNIHARLERLYDEQNFLECLKLEKDIERLAKTTGDTTIANSFFYIGDAHNQLGELDKAIQWFDREKNLRVELGLQETEEYSGSLYNLAYLNLQAGNYDEAGALASQLIANDKKLYEAASEEYLLSVTSAVDIYIRLDKFDDAEKLLQSTIRQQPKNALSEGVLLTKLSDLYTVTSRYSRAEKTLNNALAIIEKNTDENSPEYINAMINFGILEMARGKFAQAEEIFDYVLNEIAPDEPAYIATLNNQGLIYKSLGQPERAEKIFREIKTIDSVSIGTAHPDFAITLTNLGFVYADEGKYIQAESVLTRALDIQKKNGESSTASYARKLNNLARVYRLSGNIEKAIPLHEQALGIFKKTLGENSADYATTLYNAAIAYWKVNRKTDALKYLKKSASVRSSLLGKRHPKYAESIQKMAEYHWNEKQLKDARTLFGEVFDNYYYQLDAFYPALTEEEKAKFYYNNIKPSFEKFNSFALDVHSGDPTILGEVFDHQINTKASILYATEKVKQAIQTSQDTLLIREFELWQAQKEQIARLYSQNSAPQQLDSLQQTADRLEKELTRKSAAFASQYVRTRLSWKDIQKKLGEHEAAIEVIRFRNYSPVSAGEFSDAISYAFLIVTNKTEKHPDILMLKNGREMESKYLNFYRNNIRFMMDDEYSYKNYVQSLAEYLTSNNIKRTYLSPDGVYNQISINTIKNPQTGNFFIDDFDVRLITNSRELVEKKTAKSNSQSSILIGYPKFNLEETSGVKTNTTRSITRGENLTRGLRGGLLRYMRGENGIAVLPGTEEEIRQIAKLTNDPEIFMEEMAAEGLIKQVISPMVLHIATHGYFLEDEPLPNGEASAYVPSPLLKAGIILAGAENFLKAGTSVNEEGDDGILTAYEAMNLTLDDTELVVLSACETGLGVVKNGEGVYGLQRAFKMAGAKSMIMSLWSVHDAATQELMSLFYSEKRKTDDQHVAFRNAQQKLKEKYAHPFYWGAFVMVGI